MTLNITVIYQMASFLLLIISIATAAPNMNGFPYAISNPHANGRFSGEYEKIDPSLEYFDVYSPPITTRYAQVYWTMLPPVPLPADVVSRFDGKTLAIRGYECNQVMKSPEGDIPVPISAAYNHHHGAVIKGKDSLLRKMPATAEDALFNHGATEVWKPEDVRPGPLRTGPSSAVLHEGNGGEFRQSYHGYPKGFAQLVESPETFNLQVMQIDTWSRDNNYTAARDGGADPFNMTSRPRGHFVPSLEPRNSMAPKGSSADHIYSGLLECPCTDRITKVVDGSVAKVKAEDTCASTDEISTAESCFEGAVAAFAPLRAFGMIVDPKVQIVNSDSLPSGCSSTVQEAPAHEASPFLRPVNATVYFNTRFNSSSKCGGATKGSTRLWGGSKKSAVDDVGLWVQLNSSTLLLTLAGPSDVWHAVGFNSSTMVGGTYAIVVDGTDGTVSEHLLGTQAAGTLLPRTRGLAVFSQTNAGGRRVTSLTMPLAALAEHRVFFDSLIQTATLPVITAIGDTPTFAYHRSKSNHKLALFPLGAPTCLCKGNGSNVAFGKGTGQLVYTPVVNEPGGAQSSIPGASATSLHFGKNCLPYPASTMLLGKNPSCDIRSYTGGQSCCHHLFSLLDKNQVTPWQDQPLIYHHKWRIWYSEIEASPATITNVIQFNWGGMASPTEYDVPQCAEGVYGCLRGADGDWEHSHNGTWTVGQMAPMAGGTPANATGVSFKTVHGHCHAPTCIVFELWNHDDGTLICRQEGIFGKTNGTFDEKGYLHVPPCVWGTEEEGLNPALHLPFNTTLFSKKVANANFGHHGEMSLWQTYGTFY